MNPRARKNWRGQVDKRQLQCGIYVDLNVIRAGEAETPETSRHTSVYDRIQACLVRTSAEPLPAEHALLEQPDRWISPFELEEGPQVDTERHVTEAGKVTGTKSR